MKRALAERAKQSGLPAGVKVAPGGRPGTSLPSPTPNASSVPDVADSMNSNTINHTTVPIIPSVPRLQAPPSYPPSQTNSDPKIKPSLPVSSSTASVAGGSSLKTTQSPRPKPSPLSPRPKKRARESSLKLEQEDDDDSNATSFYLRHQNHALASELRSTKYQLVRLERERDYRRTQCMQAVKSLNTLQNMWEKIESALEHQSHVGFIPRKMEIKCDGNTDLQLPRWDAPLSTGSGKAVEWIDALMNSLTQIGTKSSEISIPRIIGESGDEMVTNELTKNNEEDEQKTAEEIEGKNNVDGISKIAGNLEERVSLLQSWVWSLLENLAQTSASINGEGISWSPLTNTELQNQVSKAEADNVTLQEQLQEMTRSRDEIIESDRRVRRGLYRLAAGRMQLKDVLKAVANADEDKETAATWMEMNISMTSSHAAATIASTSSSVLSSQTEKAVKLESDGKITTTPFEVERLKKQVSDLRTLAMSRDELIKKLSKEKGEQAKRINSFILDEQKISSGIPTNEEVKRSGMYLELTSKLAAHTRKLKEFDEKSVIVQKEWSDALTDAEFSKKALEDMQTNFTKRWAELTDEKTQMDASHEKCNNSATGIVKVENIITLQHKLTQALENVRQAETSRKTLDEAILMNNSLQAKVEEYKSKYNALQAEKVARANSSGSGSNSNQNSSNTSAASSSAAGGLATPKSKSSSSSSITAHSSEKGDSRSIDKLHRDYKRARKEIAAITASKDAAKAKLERTEKEKDFLSQMNSRLLKQASEKDEINARSLSTILHQKQLTEQITKEKGNLEQQAKSAEQLALAARLASNARDRLAEEFNNEQKRLQSQIEKLEQKCSGFVDEKDAAETRLSQEKGRMVTLINDAQKAKKRCEELVTEATKVQEDSQNALESLAIAKREATEATKLSQRLAESKGGGLSGGFTAEQLGTQVAHLKHRLTCPVCNVRDKKCILLRCRHMFCKHCVEENVKNRSRKCPACGIRFDTKDIADVWL